jgi:hypothetical protein
MSKRAPQSPVLSALMLALGLSVLVGSPALVQAQDRSIEWKEVTRIEAPGALGALLSRLPSLTGETSYALHIRGDWIRSDRGESTQIFDARSGRMISVDHEDRSYLDLTPEDLSAAMSLMIDVQTEVRDEMAAMRQDLEAEMAAARAELAQAMAEAEGEWPFELRTEATGERRAVGPATAERHFVTVEVPTPEGLGDLEAFGIVGGQRIRTLVVLGDIWVSEDFPDADREFERRARELAQGSDLQRIAEEVSEAFPPMDDLASFDALGLWNPGIASALARVTEVFDAMEGTQVYRAYHVVGLTEGQALDRAALLAWSPAGLGEVMQDQASSVARDVAREAARGAVQGLSRGLLGRGRGDDAPSAPPASTEQPGMQPIFRLVTEFTDIRTGAPDPAVFNVPEGYTKKALPTLEEILGDRRPGSPR